MDEDELLEVKPEDLADPGYGTIIAGIFQATTRMINEYANIEFTSFVKETKCILQGDPYGEFVAELYAKAAADQISSRHF